MKFFSQTGEFMPIFKRDFICHESFHWCIRGNYIILTDYTDFVDFFIEFLRPI
jgi:hypothetical protein